MPRLSVVVAHFDAASIEFASVPQEKTPVLDDFTSQFAAFNAETVRFVVEAVSKYPVPETESAVDDA